MSEEQTTKQVEQLALEYINNKKNCTPDCYDNDDCTNCINAYIAGYNKCAERIKELEYQAERWKGLYEHRKAFSEKQQADIEKQSKDMIKGRCKDCKYMTMACNDKGGEGYCSEFSPKVTVEDTHDEPSGSFVKSCDNCRYKKDVKPFDVGICEFCKRCYVNADNSFRDCWQPIVGVEK